jgi:hypothetical protein
MKPKFFIGLLFIVLCACSTEKEIEEAAWLIGTWENKTGQGSLFETWTRVSNKEYSGISYMLQGNDTVVFETIQLIQENTGLYYIPTLMDQNEGQPVRFLLKDIGPTEMVFENQEHDFPQVISYTKMGADSLLAAISGTSNGKEIKRSFPMKRIK